MNYEWFQDEKQIKLRFEVKNTTAANINVEVAEVVVKVNVLDKKFAKTIDLFAPVIEGPIVYGNNVLEVTLIKVEPRQWLQLAPDLPKDELLKRRKDAFFKKEQQEQARKKQKEDLKLEFDKHATREQMRVEDIQRREIEGVKKSQKEEAVNDLYNKMDQNAQFTKQQKDNAEELAELDAKIQEYERQEEQQERNRKLQLAGETNTQRNQHKPENEIFDSKQVKRDEPKQLPQPRQNAAVQLGFTEKVYPHLASRETHYKDAPLPKISKVIQGDPKQRENPLFLKDKGDEFFKNKDFYSAINAYSIALKYDPQLLTALANRSACYLCQFNFNECADDCKKVMEHYHSKEKDKLYEKCHQRLRVCQAWQGDLAESIDGMPEPFVHRIRSRQESNRKKALGDQLYANGQFQKSIEVYNQALALDEENELALSNCGLVLMKMKDYDQALQMIDRAIEKSKQFVIYANLNPSIGPQSSKQAYEFLLKNYMKKSSCLFHLNREEEAHQAVKQAIKIDEMNEEARAIMNSIQLKIERNEALKLKEQGTQLLREQKYLEALNCYNECLKKLTPSDDLVNYSAVLLNKCVCNQQLEQFEEIVGLCSRGIKLIQNHNNRILAFEKVSKEDKQKLSDYLVRFLVRRSNAYLKQHQLYNAHCDLEEAVKLDPNNEQIKGDLQKLKNI